MNEWPLTETRKLPWHALQRRLADDLVSGLSDAKLLSVQSARVPAMTSWLMRALADPRGGALGQ